MKPAAKVELPIGELGTGQLVLRKGEVVSLEEGRTGGGWRYLDLVHRGGTTRLHAARLPDDAAFERIRDRLATFRLPRSS